MAKDCYGNEIDLNSWKDKGFGQFKKYVNDNLDKDWGKQKSIDEHEYEVLFVGTTTVSQRVKVKAISEKEAEQLARENLDDDDWDMCDVCDFDIQEVEELEEDD